MPPGAVLPLGTTTVTPSQRPPKAKGSEPAPAQPCVALLGGTAQPAPHELQMPQLGPFSLGTDGHGPLSVWYRPDAHPLHP